MTPSVRSHENAPSAFLVALNFAIVYVLWGSTYLALKIGGSEFGVSALVGLRFLGAGVIMLAGWWVLSSRQWPTWRELIWSVILGNVMLIGGTTTVAYAVRVVPSGTAAMLVATAPMAFAIIDRALGGPKIRPLQVVGIMIGLAGVVLLKFENTGAPAQLWWMLALVAAVVFWTGAGVCSKRVPMPKNVYLSSAVQMLSTGVVMMAFGWLAGEYTLGDLTHAPPSAVWAILYLIVFGSCLGFTAYAWLLKHQPTARVSTYAFVNPAVAVVLGTWYGEAFTPIVFFSLILIAGGVALMLFASPAPAKALPPLVDEPKQLDDALDQQAHQQQEKQCGHREAENRPALLDHCASAGPCVPD